MGAGEAPWADALGAIIGGNASGVEVVIIWIFVGAGMLRWYFGWEWLLYAVVDELYLSRPVADAYIREPLLPKPQSTSEAQPAVASGAAKQDTSCTRSQTQKEVVNGLDIVSDSRQQALVQAPLRPTRYEHIANVFCCQNTRGDSTESSHKKGLRQRCRNTRISVHHFRSRVSIVKFHKGGVDTNMQQFTKIRS